MNSSTRTDIMVSPVACESDIKSFGAEDGLVGVKALINGEYMDIERSVPILLEAGNFECPYCHCKMVVHKLNKGQDFESDADDDELLQMILEG